MERRDGRNPFDIATYTLPATIKSMIELRAFCAAFFEEHVRDSSSTTDQELLDQFSSLICHSTLLFARARAVIPELQRPIPKNTLMQMNPNIQRVLQRSEDLCGLPDSSWDHLIEESAWTRLAKDGEVQFKKEAERIAQNLKGNRPVDSGSPLRLATPNSMIPTGFSGRKEQAAGPVSPLCLSINASMEPMEAKDATYTITTTGAIKKSENGSVPNSSIKSPATGAAQNSRPIRLETIPMFIPRAQMSNAYDLVWSPTTGTRQRRPEEKLESQRHDQAVPREFGQQVSGNILDSIRPHPILSSSKVDTVDDRRDRGLDALTIGRTEPFQNPISPLAPPGSPFSQPRSTSLSSHQIRYDLDVGPLPDYRSNSAGLTAKVGQQLHHTYSADGIDNMSLNSNFNNLRLPVSGNPGIIGAERFPASSYHSDFDGNRDLGQGVREVPEAVSHQSSARYGLYAEGGRSFFQDHPGNIPYNVTTNASFQPQPSQALQSDLPSHPRKPWYPQEQHNRPRRHHRSHREGQYSVGAYPQQQPFDVTQAICNAQMANYDDPAQRISYGGLPSELLTIPARGSMHPVDYWNRLYQCEIDVHTRLASAGMPMTDIARDYVARLGEARIATVASKMPLRGQMAPMEWLDVLAKELDGLQLPGVMPLTSVIVDRKKDYGSAVRREMELVEIELGIELGIE